MTRHMWYVTPIANAAMRVAGPFDTYEQAEQECLLRLDRLTAIRAVAGGRVSVYYLPRLFAVVENGSVTLVKTGPPPRIITRHPRAQPRAELPRVIYTYSQHDLLVLCEALGITPPAHGTSREHLIDYMETELAKLAGREATPRK